jgi:hypothetical protein
MPTTSFVARLLSGPYAEIVASGYLARERWESRIRSLWDSVWRNNQERGGLRVLRGRVAGSTSNPTSRKCPSVVITMVSLNSRMTAKLVQSERKVLVAILGKVVPRPFETIVLDALPSQSGAAIDLLPPCVRRCEPEATSNQRQRLLDDEVGRDQEATGLERRSERPPEP